MENKFQLKENSGNAFANDKKGNEKAPDWKGTINVGGKVYWLSMWEKNGNKGDYFSISVQPQEPKPQVSIPEPTTQTNDGLPF